jgi:Flp pilus assembly protein TadG
MASVKKMAYESVNKTRGAAMLELALLSPWVIFLFIGVVDWGFYAVSLISLENATRVAAVYASTGNSSDTDGICTILRNELGSLSNMQGVSTCGGSSPVSFTPTTLTGASSPDGNNAIQMSVTYTTPQMIPIPGLLASKFTITRTVKMRSTT